MESATSRVVAKTPAAAKPARERVLPVAEVFAVVGAERLGPTQTLLTLVVGDERNPPRRHGLRATRAEWFQIVRVLAAEDETFRDQLRAFAAPSLHCDAITGREPVAKPSGHLL